MLLQAVAAATILALAWGWSATSARADGDPASDVLAQRALYLAQDADVTATEQAELGALLQSATRSGYQLRVALIASPVDLGSVTELWRQPQNYARFLGQELSLVYRGPLLVIMPDGLGLSDLTRPLAGDQSALAGLRAPTAGVRLGPLALAAIQRLAAAAGHVLPVPHGAVPSNSNSSSTGTASWIVFAIGTVLIALAWTASLRVRSLRLWGRDGVSP